MQIDLRSDTFTQPTQAMLNVMFNAKTGDDVFGEDPAVNQLESETAALFGMESALFCPSGTMTNQIAIKCHTQPGNEVICEKQSHVYIYEGGGIAFNSGCQVKPIEGNRGKIHADQVMDLINNDDIHKPVTALVSVENTANRGGGSCYEWNELASLSQLCKEKSIAFHLDGARLWNAIIAKNQHPRQFGEIFDSISVCLSKGLGAPVGSLLLGNKKLIQQARRVRKVMGGGMRQAGFLAAAGLYAIEHHLERLQEDHENAKIISQVLLKKDFVSDILPVETNMIIFKVDGRFNAQGLSEQLKSNGVLCIPISSNQIRMVFHLDVTPKMIQNLIQIIEQL